IASEYMKLGFDVMMGGGKEYFDGRKREDKRNILGDFIKADFQVVHDKTAMNKTVAGKPILGIFYDDGLPFTLDQQSDSKLTKTIPTLAEMTKKSISLMKENGNGFVLQVEGGKVDWAAHANDASALLYDQMAFEEAVSVAVNFAKQRKDTLVIITTDHGNSNPGLIKHNNVDKMFDTMQTAKHTNEWILNGINKTDSVSSIIERINFAQGITLKKEEAQKILEQYQSLENGGIYNPYKLPYKLLADIQKKYTSIYWSGTNHSADYVELAMFGAGSEALPAFVKNIDLHHYMLAAAGVQKQVSAS
ncbi:MAG: alkaline phosphatase, partial [Bacteroidales bacterium]|nr:alkaline phosphatase [Bacteroidales bacterium]